jgi:tetrahydromethanopterin S-methyltransferase subunit B
MVYGLWMMGMIKMSIETSRIIIDDNLEMDVNTGIIGVGVSSNKVESAPVFPTEELMLQIDKLEDAINDLESSFDYNSTSRLSQPNREGIYKNMGLITNIVLGIIIGLILILLLM